MLPTLRTTRNDSSTLRSTFANDKTNDKSSQGKKEGGTTPGAGKSEGPQSTRNKTPAGRFAGGGGGFGFPSQISEGTKRSKELYSMNYILDIDNQTYSSR